MADANGKQVSDPKKYCPFLGIVAVPIQKQFSNEVSIGMQMSACVEEKCIVWDEQKKCCTLKAAIDTIGTIGDLVQANKGKLSLLSMFGPKKA